MNLETSSATSPSHPHKCQKSGRLICPDSQRSLYCLQAFMMKSGDDLSMIEHLFAEKNNRFLNNPREKVHFLPGIIQKPIKFYVYDNSCATRCQAMVITL
nr:MAG TPA: hypothetical protein [Caudoviricetes sp.]